VPIGRRGFLVNAAALAITARSDVAMDWVDRSWRCSGTPASTYVNYLSRDDNEAVRAAYQSNMQRLVALKRRYDPSNLFHLNRNARP